MGTTLSLHFQNTGWTGKERSNNRLLVNDHVTKVLFLDLIT
jgi:hypothetical protein